MGCFGVGMEGHSRRAGAEPRNHIRQRRATVCCPPRVKGSICALVVDTGLRRTDRLCRATGSEHAAQAPSWALLEQVGMAARAHEDDLLSSATPLQPVDQQEVAADVALTVVSPFADKCVVQPLWLERRIVGDQQQHRLFQAFHVEPARMSQARPVLDECLGSVRCPRQEGALIAWRFFQDLG